MREWARVIRPQEPTVRFRGCHTQRLDPRHLVWERSQTRTGGEALGLGARSSCAVGQGRLGDWKMPSTWVGQKGQNRRLEGPGARSLTLVAALAQLQGDDLPGHRSSDVGAPARLGERHCTDESLAAGRAGRGERSFSSSFDAGARSARVQYRPPRGQRARMPNLGIISRTTLAAGIRHRRRVRPRPLLPPTSAPRLRGETSRAAD